MRGVFDSEPRHLLLSKTEVFVPCCRFLDLIEAGLAGSFKELTLEKIFITVTSLFKRSSRYCLVPLLFTFPTDDMNDGVQRGPQFLFADNLELHIADRQANHKRLECSYQSLNDRKFLIPPTERKNLPFARREAVPGTKRGSESLMFVKTFEDLSFTVCQMLDCLTNFQFHESFKFHLL